jgi:hypothetical protein
MHTKCCSENLKGRYHSEYLGIDGENNIRLDLKERGWECVVDCDWLRRGTNGGLL